MIRVVSEAISSDLPCMPLNEGRLICRLLDCSVWLLGSLAFSPVRISNGTLCEGVIVRRNVNWKQKLQVFHKENRRITQTIHRPLVGLTLVA